MALKGTYLRARKNRKIMNFCNKKNKVRINMQNMFSYKVERVSKRVFRRGNKALHLKWTRNIQKPKKKNLKNVTKVLHRRFATLFEKISFKKKNNKKIGK